MVYTKSEL